MEKERERGTELVTRLTAMDVVGAVFAYSELPTFPSDRKFLHTFFREAKEDTQFSGILEDFVFSEVDIYPFSRRLEAAINKLQLSRSIAADNPRYARFKMENEGREMEKNIIQKNSPKSVDLLVSLGKKFAESCEDYERKRRERAEEGGWW